MKLYNFMQDDKWYEDLGHIAIGIFLPFYGWWREHRQWPPGDLITIFIADDEEMFAYGDFGKGRLFSETDRVADSYRDFLGYAVGDVIRTIGLLAYALS